MYEFIKIVGDEDDLPEGNGPLLVLDLATKTLRPVSGGSFKIAGVKSQPKLTAANEVTAGAATYTTAQIAGGLITRDPTGGARTDIMPAAADLIADLGLTKDGDAFEFYLINTADAAEAITLGGTPTGVTYANAGQTLAQNEAARVIVVRTSSTTVTVYIVGA
jgi:hypothetical protein